MATTLTAADRSRVSNDMIPVTADLIVSMLSQSMVSKDALAGIVRDVHMALTDISMDNIEIASGLDVSFDATIASLIGSPSAPPAARGPVLPLAPAVARSSTQSAVDELMKLGTSSSTILEPKITPSVRVPPTVPRQLTLPIPPAPARPPTARAPEQPIAPKVAPQASPAKNRPILPVPVAEPEVRRSQPASKGKTASEAPKWSGEERRANPIVAKPKVPTNVLPRRLTSIEEALTMDYVVCLEDGKKARGSMVEHLASLKNPMTPDEYRAKWKLPAEYPMSAPSAIIKKGEVYEIDLVTGKIKKPLKL